MAKKKKKKDKKEFNGNIIEDIQTISNLYEKKLDKKLVHFDLSSEQYKILKILGEGSENGYSVKQIRGFLSNQTSNTTRLVEKLKVKELIQKKTFSSDKREVRINLTQMGKNVLNDLNAKIEKLNTRLNSSIKSKNAAILLESLNKLMSELKN